jgi:hypothetical protein
MLNKTFKTTSQINNEYAQSGRNHMAIVTIEQPGCGFIPMPKNTSAATSIPTSFMP